MNTSKLHTTRFFLSRRDLMRTAAVAAAGLGAGLLGLAPGQGTAAENSPTNPAPIQQGKGHPFVCTDYTGGKVFIVTADGKAEWEYPAETCNDLWVLPNGNLLVSGEKQVSVGEEQEFVRISGVVNPSFVDANNTVESSKIADARIEYKSSGQMAEAQTMGWLARFFLNVLPF